ncbi:uncharacterized protein B0T15DRAFT_538948 [Chaetomium strumarium]|uniref:Uncharacterized protein n=1 Tax=Chaetomium strumarium TaxID=1170767 RepID=A0AAJ0GN63_9PEZI|nr:hypothetical protein B0T15DRAFT_538948 [Chaetomium strumarium]
MMSASQPQYATAGFVIDLAAVVNTNEPGHRMVVPGAKEAIASLQDQKIPFVLLTRETGLTEKQVARGLEKRLGLKIGSGSIVLPQTPFREQVNDYQDKVVVVIGGEGDKAQKAAMKYGFKHVMITKDIVDLYPHLYNTGEHCLHPTPPKPWISARGDDIKVSAIFVWRASDPANWDLDIGICVDLLLTKQGYIGTHTTKNLNYLQHWPEQQPQLFICKADTAPAPGAGQGYGYPVPLRDGKTWLSTLEDRWTDATGLPLDDVQYKYFGAACNDDVTVRHMDRVLRERSKKLDHRRDRTGNCQHDHRPFLRTVYMIGKDIDFGARSDAYEVDCEPRARRRSVRIDPLRKAQLREAAVHDFAPEVRPWHVAGSLKEAVEYALTEEYWECVEAGLKPLWARPEGAITLV